MRICHAADYREEKNQGVEENRRRSGGIFFGGIFPQRHNWQDGIRQTSIWFYKWQVITKLKILLEKDKKYNEIYQDGNFIIYERLSK